MPVTLPSRGRSWLTWLAGLLTAATGLAAIGGMAFSLAPPAGPERPDAVIDAVAVAVAPRMPLRSAEFAVELPTLTRVSGRLQPRDTLADLIERLGANRVDTYAALQSLYADDLVDPRRLRPGVEAVVTLEADGTPQDGAPLRGLTLRTAPEFSLVVTRRSDGRYDAAKLEAKLDPVHKRVARTIETSIYAAALSAGAGDQQVVDFAQIFAYDIDFQREVHPGDRFEIVYESFVDEKGNTVRAGDVIYAELDGKTLSRGFYRHTPSDDGITDYYDREGKSARKFLMKTPINGARLSSNFGYRRHPISGYTRLHKGTDFAAPSGTPIFAAGHGVVERASRYGGYGNYVRLRHANGFKTAYAHMLRYGPGIRAGRRVRQGDIIGYVGSTGASTGPHLHYEVHKDGKAVNPMQLKLPTGRILEGEQLDAFERVRLRIDRIRRDLGAPVGVAGAPDTPTRKADPAP